MFLEGNLLEEWVGIRMFILVLDSLIFWDHSYPSNYLILSYILRKFSWKRLSKIHWGIGERIVWRTYLEQQLGDSSKSIKKIRSSSCKYWSSVCMLEPRAIERKLATSRLSGCNLYFQLIWYSVMSFSHKAILTLLCNSLIIHISWLLNIFCYLHFGWFVLSWSWPHESTRVKREQQTP